MPYQQNWAPARGHQHHRRNLGQEAVPAPPAQVAPAAPPAVAPGAYLNWQSEPVQTFLVSQGVVLAYALTAGFFYGKKSELVDRIILGVGAAGFGAASWASYRMAFRTPRPNTATQITGGVMGTVDAVTAVGAAIGALKAKPVRRSIQEAVVDALPI